MKKLLLHSCCGPCTSGALLGLANDELDMTAFFYNPNIHPKDEYIKRLDSFNALTLMTGLKSIVDDEYDMEKYLKDLLTTSDRCSVCYTKRLERTAKAAKENGHEYISTTLLISPYQKHELIKEIGERIAQAFDLKFYYKDLRPFYKASVEISKEKGLYRQKFCGCAYSEKEAKDQIKKKEEHK